MDTYFWQEDNSLDIHISGNTGFSVYVKVIMNARPLNCNLLMKKDAVIFSMA